MSIKKLIFELMNEIDSDSDSDSDSELYLGTEASSKI